MQLSKNTTLKLLPLAVALLLATPISTALATPPTAVCQDITVDANASCEAEVAASQVDGGSFDNDGYIDSRTLVPAGPYTFGVNPVKLIIVDNDGEVDTCDALITVADNTPPDLNNCPSTIVEKVAPGQTQTTVTYDMPTASDNCDIDPIILTSHASGTSFPIGSTIVTITATDDAGNADTCKFTVIVTAPTARISLQSIEGLVGEGQLSTGEPIRFNLRITNLSTADYSDFSNGFRIFSPDGAEWDTTKGEFTERADSLFDSLEVVSVNVTGADSDTIGFKSVSNSDSGFVSGFDEIAITIEIGPIAEQHAGKTICLDSTIFAAPPDDWFWTDGSYTVNPDWYGPLCYTICSPLDEAPTLVLPEDSSENLGTTVFFDWSGVAGSDDYRLEIDEDGGDFSSPILTHETFSSQYEASDFEKAATYQWRVSAHNICGWGEPSDPWTFSTSFISITGHVLTMYDHEPVPDILLDLYKQGQPNILQSITSGDEGDYLFDNLTQGTYTIKVTTDSVANVAVYEDFELTDDTTGMNVLVSPPDSGNVPLFTDEFDAGVIPNDFALAQNRPNPFNPSTIIDFFVPRGEVVKLEVFDILGRRVATLADEHLPRGWHSLAWSGTNSHGQAVPSGVYLYRLSSADFSSTKKMILLK